MGMETAALAIKLKLELNPMTTRSEPSRTEPNQPIPTDPMRSEIEFK